MLAIEQYTRRLLKDFHPIVAANRPPVDLAPDPTDRERFVRGSGGLVTGLSGLAKATGAVWVASVRDGFEGELELGEGGEPMMVETTDGSRFQVSWVNPPRLAYDLYYNTIANPLLWFVQHYLWNLAEAPVLDDSTHRAWTEGYRLVNQLFAQQIVREARRRMTTTSTWCPGWFAASCPMRSCSISSTSPGRRRSTGRCCRTTCAMRSWTACWRRTSSVCRRIPTCVTSC